MRWGGPPGPLPLPGAAHTAPGAWDRDTRPAHTCPWELFPTGRFLFSTRVETPCSKSVLPLNCSHCCHFQHAVGQFHSRSFKVISEEPFLYTNQGPCGRGLAPLMQPLTCLNRSTLLPTPPASAAAPWRDTPVLPPAWSPLLHVKTALCLLGYSSFCGSYPIIQPNDSTQQAFNQKSLDCSFSTAVF